MLGFLRLRFGRSRLFNDPKLLGEWGEKRSRRLLQSKGFKTLATNFRCKSGEIDLVMAEPGGAVVFVEVKTRTAELFAPAEAAVNIAKRVRLSRAAKRFLAIHNIQDRPFRFDVVTVVVGVSGPVKIDHYQNAFVP